MLVAPALTFATPTAMSREVRDRAVVWGSCPPLAPGNRRDPRERCGTLRVPLDYRHPNGSSITIAVSRIATAKPAMRRGIMLLNPGGPGSEGLDWANQIAPLLPSAVLDRFDLIGFDPRGVGHSTPVTCGISRVDSLNNTLPYPAPNGSIAANVAYSKRTARNCAARAGRLLPFITTANVARDMDRIRAALDERRLSYYGASYGTYLGAVYASLFPHRVDRMVLDSAVDPRKVWYRMWQTWSVGAAERFPDAANYVAGHNDTVGFGSIPAAVTTRYLALAHQLDVTPVRAGSIQLTGNVLRSFTYNLLYYDAALPELGALWRAATDFQAGTATAGDETVIEQVLGFVDPVPSPGVPVDNGLAAAYAVVCDDVAWPRSSLTYARNTAADRLDYPLTDGMPSNVWPCAYWAERPIEAPVTISDRGRRDILILQNERDPATPLAAGLGMRQALGRRAEFVQVDAGGHGVIVDQNPCAQAVTENFLGRGVLAPHDVQCPAT